MDSLIINATKDQLEEFKESVLWADIVRELESWSKGFNLEMMSIVSEAETKNPSSASVLMHIGDLHGRQMAVEYFLSIPDVFLQILEDKKDDTKY